MKKILIQRKYLFVVLLVGLCGLNSLAQEKVIRNLEISFSIGVADYRCDSLPNIDHVDWANYIGEKDYIEAITVKWGARFDLFQNWKADLALTMQDDFLPLNLKLSLQYFPLKWLGVHGGVKLFHTYIEDGKQYFKQTQPDYYYYFQDYESIALNNISFYVGPVFNFTFGPVSWITTLNAGLSRQPGFNDVFRYKLPNDNQQGKVDFAAESSLAFMCGANSLVQIDCCLLGNMTLGFQVRTDFQFNEMKIDYRQREVDWLRNTSEQKIVSVKHKFSWIEGDAGIYLRF